MVATTKGKPSSCGALCNENRWPANGNKAGGRGGRGGEEAVKVIHGDACPGILIAALTLIGLHDAL